MIVRNLKQLSFVITAVFVLACVTPTLVPVSDSIPTFDPNAPLTAIVKTADAAMTQTAQFAPPTLTPTATPTRTPFPTETITPTFIFVLPTSTVPPTQIPAGSSGLELECQMLSQDPPDNTIFAPQATFTTRWNIANVGLNTWPSDNTDYRYFSGDRFHLQPIYDFEKSVVAGDSIELVVAMQAPNQTGVFTTSWRISIGNERFCPMNITIIVS